MEHLFLIKDHLGNGENANGKSHTLKTRLASFIYFAGLADELFYSFAAIHRLVGAISKTQGMPFQYLGFAMGCHLYPLKFDGKVQGTSEGGRRHSRSMRPYCLGNC